MGPTLEDMLAELPAAQRKAVKRRADELIAEELSLADLRKALKLTQVEVAQRLAKGQEVVSRLEKRSDLLISTVRDYVHSLGGELELVARFGEGRAVRIQPGPRAAPRKDKKGRAALPA